MFGQEMLSSIPATSATGIEHRDAVHVILDRSTRDVDDHWNRPADASAARSRRRRHRYPGSAEPMLLSMPPPVSATRGGGLPSRGCHGRALRVQRAETVDVDQLLELEPVPRRPAGQADRVGQREPASEVDAVVVRYRSCDVGARKCEHGLPVDVAHRHHGTVGAAELPDRVRRPRQCIGSAHPRQVPKPQPIGASSDASRVARQLLLRIPSRVRITAAEHGVRAARVDGRRVWCSAPGRAAR